MIFFSFAKLEEMGLPRPSLAPEGAVMWTKLYPHILKKRKGNFTTIRAVKPEWSYKAGVTVPVYIDEKKPNHKLYDAKITDVKMIKKIDIDAKLAKGDADMTVEELYRFFDFFYFKKYGKNPQLQKISLRRVE